MNYEMEKYDVIVVGAGHAGYEAALASARMGKKTLLAAINLESIAMMPCNPSIGGTGKGHLVREIDALGGEMAINIDKTFIQSKMLNTRKGPAVHSLRCQADKEEYHREMKKTIERTENLTLRQMEIVDLIVEENSIVGVVSVTNAVYKAKAVIIATGTFLNGKIFIGESSFTSGPNGLAPSLKLAESLKKHGIEMRRFKTGTPARVLASSLNYENMQEEIGDEEIVPFSFLNDHLEKNQVSCWLTYTNEKTHEIIRNNFNRSALFGGEIEGIGPRYCPSIEDKVNRFSDKERHQTFIEPEGLSTDEMYVQGMSSSLPEDVLDGFFRTIPGLENLVITRPAYAIEYDSVNPLTLKMNLESRKIENLFFAGQINGSSGYEEAAAQGLMAGINAVLKIEGKEPFIIDRSQGYIGVLIDDLVIKGTNEPYRIMTSRAEYRLILRQDNADIRLTELSYKLGLASKERYNKFMAKQEKIKDEIERLKKKEVYPGDVKEYLEEMNTSPLKNKISLFELLKRPELTYSSLERVDDEMPKLAQHEITQLEVQIKYEGYIGKQLAQIERFKRLEKKQIPEGINYLEIDGLRIEARQKLDAIRPMSIGQASRISGVSPADINVLLIYLEKCRRENV